MRGALIITALLSLTLGCLDIAQGQSADELREQLQSAGMSPSEIDEVLKSVEEISGSMGLQQQSGEPIPDVDDLDPAVIACRNRYSNIVTKTALDNFGDRLGTNALRIGQTCSAAAAGGTLERRALGGDVWPEGAWAFNRGELSEITRYWQKIVSFNAHLANPEDIDIDDSDLELGSPRYNEITSSFSSDLQTLITEDEDSTESYRIRALPIHERCEFIRAEVTERFKENVNDGEVCLISTVPEPAHKYEEGQ